MTVVTTRADATVAAFGLSATGAASRHAALSDDSDISYINGAYDDVATLGFAEPSIPAGGRVKTIVIRMRIARTVAIPTGYRVYYALAGTLSTDPLTVFPTWSTPTTITVLTLATDTVPTDLRVQLHKFFGGTNDAPVYEMYVDTTYVALPVVVVDAPTGTITNTNTPAISWTDTLDTDGGAQTAYEVKVFHSSVYGAGGFNPATSTGASIESGITTGAAASWQSLQTLPNGTYRAYVRVAQTVNGAYHWSAWAYSGFTINVALPAVPLLTATPENDDARVRIDIDHQSGAATTDALEVQRSADNVTWEPLRLTTDTDGVILATDATVYDMEGGNGQTVYYRARALHNYSGEYAASAWATDDAAWTSSTWWLKSVLHPSLNAPVYPHSVPSYQRPARQGVFQALGATRALVVSDTRGADRGTIVFRVDTDSQASALNELLDSGEVLLLQGAPGQHWTDRYVVLGDLDRARLVDKAYVEGTLDTLTWVEVDAPVGVIDDWPEIGS